MASLLSMMWKPAVLSLKPTDLIKSVVIGDKTWDISKLTRPATEEHAALDCVIVHRRFNDEVEVAAVASTLEEVTATLSDAP